MTDYLLLPTVATARQDLGWSQKRAAREILDQTGITVSDRWVRSVELGEPEYLDRLAAYGHVLRATGLIVPSIPLNETSR